MDIAVADTFDTITSNRPYRDKRNSAGTQLCPEGCSIFEKLRPEIYEILNDVNVEIEERNNIISG